MTSAISAIVSLLLAIITSLAALYLVLTRPKVDNTSKSDDIVNLSQQIENKSAAVWTSWHHDQFLDFLSGFLLPDELKVIGAMADFFIKDADGKQLTKNDEYGWRNKHRIITATGVPQRIIYSKTGIIERLVKLDMIQIRDSKSGWGKQKYHYRLNPDNEFVSAFLAS